MSMTEVFIDSFNYRLNLILNDSANNRTYGWGHNGLLAENLDDGYINIWAAGKEDLNSFEFSSRELAARLLEAVYGDDHAEYIRSGCFNPDVRAKARERTIQMSRSELRIYQVQSHSVETRPDLTWSEALAIVDKIQNSDERGSLMFQCLVIRDTLGNVWPC